MSNLRVVQNDLTFGGGSGPEDPMLERIEKLETKTDRIEAILLRLEPKITELFLTCAKQSDLTALKVEVGEIKAEIKYIPKANDYSSLRADISKIEGRTSMLPTWWMLLIAMLATWGAGASIVWALLKAAKP
jgi:hypothetical protein